MRESRCVDTCLCVPAWVSWSLCLCACGCVCVSQRICAQPGRREGIPDLRSVSERGPDPEGPPSKTHQAPGQEHDAKGLVVANVSDSVRPHRRQPTRLPRPWDSPGKNTRVGCHFLLQCMKVKVKSLSRVRFLATPWTAAYQAPPSMGFSRQECWSGVPSPTPNEGLLLSRFSRVRLCATPQTEAHEAPPSLGFSRQEHWSGLPFPEGSPYLCMPVVW